MQTFWQEVKQHIQNSLKIQVVLTPKLFVLALHLYNCMIRKNQQL